MQIERRWAGVEAVAVPDGVQRPGAKPARRGDHVKVMMDLIALALQTDQTRIATFKLGAMGCQYPELGSPNTYHTYTHGAGTSEAARKNMIAVDRERIGHLAYFLGKLRDIPDGEHNLLHNSFVHYGAGMGKTHGEGEADGDVVPNLTAGHAGRADSHRAAHRLRQKAPDKPLCFDVAECRRRDGELCGQRRSASTPFEGEPTRIPAYSNHES